MCRMMGAVGAFEEASRLVGSFRGEAERGRRLVQVGGHHDGWGIVAGAPPAHAGRSVMDAMQDPGYLEAAGRVARPGRGVAVAHLRAASVGAIDVENSHPFVQEGLAFCHNGTIRGLEGPGGSDSRGYFAMVLEEVRAGLSPGDALAAAARQVAKAYTYSSVTALLTDGRTLWGVRKVGDDPEECADAACAADYYTLGVSRLGGLTVVAQEHESLPRGAAWDVVPDGGMVTVAPDGSWRVARVF